MYLAIGVDLNHFFDAVQFALVERFVSVGQKDFRAVRVLGETGRASGQKSVDDRAY